jgi:zinc/manganese transport system permease protein
VRVARWGVVAILALSAILLMVAPRADHPVLDSIEGVWPSVRELYFTAGELEVYRDADTYAARYRRQADELNERETRSRAEGQPLDDLLVRRISSFIKSYTEMRRGEEFVKREVRGRARERVRWIAGGAMLLLALVIAPGLLRRLVPLR